jgi:hypothetical protein
MRNRNLVLFLSAVIATLLVAGCAQTRQLTQQEQDRFANLKGMIEVAEAKDAKSCAPKELATAQATLDDALIECTQSWEKCDAGKKPKGAAADAQKAADALFKKLQACEDAKKVPVITVTVEPEMVPPGKCATIKWTTENVEKLFFGSDVKKAKSPELPLYGTKEVCPKETTKYQLSGKGPKLTVYEFATVKVGQ